jgi:hypothetical protein
MRISNRSGVLGAVATRQQSSVLVSPLHRQGFECVRRGGREAQCVATLERRAAHERRQIARERRIIHPSPRERDEELVRRRLSRGVQILGFRRAEEGADRALHIDAASIAQEGAEMRGVDMSLHEPRAVEAHGRGRDRRG